MVEEVDPLVVIEAMPGGRKSVLEAIRSRRSVGKVRPERPPRDVIEQIVEAATWAPNHRLTEPWRFYVLAGDARAALGQVMGRAQAARASSTADPAATFAKAAAKPLRAPVVIAVAVEPTGGPKVVEVEEVAAGAAAVQNMLLAAHELGLAAIWRTGILPTTPRSKPSSSCRRPPTSLASSTLGTRTCRRRSERADPSPTLPTGLAGTTNWGHDGSVPRSGDVASPPRLESLPHRP